MRRLSRSLRTRVCGGDIFLLTQLYGDFVEQLVAALEVCAHTEDCRNYDADVDGEITSVREDVLLADEAQDTHVRGDRSAGDHGGVQEEDTRLP